MNAAVSGLVVAGRTALADGEWARARACLEQAADRESSGPVLEGLAQALFSLGQYAEAIERGEQAFAAFRAGGDDVEAAMCARFVGYLHGVVHGDGGAMRGWLARAVRLIEAAGDCPERARIELTRATVSSDPLARDQHLTAATEIAERHGDADLLLDAMSLRGLHLVAAGDVTDGMALLDEALAAVAAGEIHDLVSVGAIYCKLLHACELTSDVQRAEEWLSLADGFVARTNRIPISAICRTHYGGVLIAAGRWADAERELAAAIDLYDRSYRALRGAAVVRLALLRVRQGRLTEAAALLSTVEHDAYSILPRMELHLACREPELAVACAERALRNPMLDLPAPALLLQIRACLHLGDRAGAATALGRLSARAGEPPSGVLGGLLHHGAGLVALAQGEPTALTLLERALAVYGRYGLPLDEGRVRLDVAGALTETQPAMALAEARRALECFRGLCAARDVDAAAGVLRRLGVRGHSGARAEGSLTRREQEVLQLLGDGLSNAAIADRLFVSRRTAEHHVSNILAKLGLTTRAEAAAYVVRQAVER